MRIKKNVIHFEWDEELVIRNWLPWFWFAWSLYDLTILTITSFPFHPCYHSLHHNSFLAFSFLTTLFSPREILGLHFFRLILLSDDLSQECEWWRQVHRNWKKGRKDGSWEKKVSLKMTRSELTAKQDLDGNDQILSSVWYHPLRKRIKECVTSLTLMTFDPF